MWPNFVEIADGQVRSVRFGATEVCRRISYLPRDNNWATAPAVARIETSGQGGAVIQSQVSVADIRFDFRIDVALQDGALVVAARGVARSAFQANRVGFSFLRPTPDSVGAPVTCQHTDRPAESTQFPVTIAPDQPMLDIARMTYPLPSGATLDIRFDAKRADGSPLCFEMEDQRNWGDASYQTYVGSLLDPWPFDVAAEDVFEQTIRLEVTAPAEHVGEKRPSARRPKKPEFHLPTLGITLPEGRATEA